MGPSIMEAAALRDSHHGRVPCQNITGTRTVEVEVQPERPEESSWFSGWLFSISFAHLVWWKIILGLVVWPYFLGTYLG